MAALLVRSVPLLAQCGPATPRFIGPLCGPPDRPCSVLDDQRVPAKDAPRNGVPALAIDRDDLPVILFSEATSGFPGFLARRGRSHDESLTVVLHYVSADGGEAETVHLRYDRPGFPPTRSQDGGRTWQSDDGE